MGAVYRAFDQRRAAAGRAQAAADRRRRAPPHAHVRARVPHARGPQAPAHHRGLRLRRRRARRVLHDGAARRARPARARAAALSDACRYLRDVASSLALLHARRLLHRDVTPRNVRITADGRAKLIDFGALSSFGTSTTVVGTPPCVPPEALRRLRARSARRSVFARRARVLGADRAPRLRRARDRRAARGLAQPRRRRRPSSRARQPDLPRDPRSARRAGAVAARAAIRSRDPRAPPRSSRGCRRSPSCRPTTSRCRR